MTYELRKALRRANLENGHMLAVSICNSRRLGLFTGMDRLIGWFVLDDAEFTEATRWWVMFGADDGSRRPGFTPVNPPLRSNGAHPNALHHQESPHDAI